MGVDILSPTFLTLFSAQRTSCSLISLPLISYQAEFYESFMG